MLRLIIYSSIKFKTLAKEQLERQSYSYESAKSPTSVTLRNWTLKLGYYILEQEQKPKDEWIIILDHSIQFGQDKIFAVFGITVSNFNKLNRPLIMRDLSPLLLKAGKNWNGNKVSQELEKLKTKYGSIHYAVGDYGSDLRKGLRLSNIRHVHDLSHMFALLIEKTYSEAPDFKNFKKDMSLMRMKFIQTDIAAIVPPNQRNKAEYQSFDTMVVWAKKAINLYYKKIYNIVQRKRLKDKYDEKVLVRMKKELRWLLNYKELVDELAEVSRLCRKIEKRFKHKGFSSKTFKYATKMLKSSGNQRIKDFQGKLLEKLTEQYSLMLGEDKFLCSSDILESTFGAYKNRQSENKMASISNLMLIMAAFTADINEDLVKKVMESVKIKDIEKWSNDEIGISLTKQRRDLLSAA